MAFFFLLIGIVLLPFVLLAIPIEIEYAYDSKSGLKSTTHIVWLFGLLRFQAGSNKKEEQWEGLPHEAAPKRRAARKPAKRYKKGFKVFLAILRSEGFIRRISRLLYAILTVARIRQLRAKFIFGLDDPADTGIAYGLLMPGFSFLYAIPQVDFVATPIFDRSVIETNMQMKIRLVPINYLKAVIFFVFSKETFRAAKAAYKAHRQ